jgi:hypothetical protein
LGIRFHFLEWKPISDGDQTALPQFHKFSTFNGVFLAFMKNIWKKTMYAFRGKAISFRIPVITFLINRLIE